MTLRLVTRSLLILAALPLAGALYQSYSVRRDSTRFPPPGQLVQIPGRRLHLICLGQGQPTVIFEPSGLGGALSSPKAREEIGAHTRVCSYDRMGMGWSDAGPGTIPASLLASDLEHLTATLEPPFLLVPASIGGLTAELFARRHPDRVAGLVFVDAANSVVAGRFFPQVTRFQVESACLVKVPACLGVLRLLDPLGLRKLPPDEAPRAMALMYRVEPVATLCGLLRGMPDTLRELAAAPPFPSDLPLVALLHEKPDNLLPPGFAAKAREIDREWIPLQQRFVQQSTRGTWRVVPGSDHLIGSSQPHAVADAVLGLLAQLRH